MALWTAGYERADIEAFVRSCRPTERSPRPFPACCSDWPPTARGLCFTPRVPSSLDGFEVNGLGYAQTVWKIHRACEP